MPGSLIPALYETLIHARRPPPSCGAVCGTDLRVSCRRLLICTIVTAMPGARGNIFLPVPRVKPITLGTQRKWTCHILRASVACPRPFMPVFSGNCLQKK